MRFVTKRGWEPFHPKEALQMHPGRASFNFRAESFARIYVASSEEFEDEILAGIGEGDLECEVIGFGPLWVRFESEGRLWLRSEEIGQRTIAVYGTSFTEVMTRGNVSPEMKYMQQMLRQQELDRRRETAEWASQWDAMQTQMEGLRNGTDGRGRRLAKPEVVGSAAKDGGDDAGSSNADSGKSESLSGAKTAAAGAKEPGTVD